MAANSLYFFVLRSTPINRADNCQTGSRLGGWISPSCPADLAQSIGTADLVQAWLWLGYGWQNMACSAASLMQILKRGIWLGDGRRMAQVV